MLNRKERVLAHYWYFPDSYDTWLAARDVQGKPEPYQQRGALPAIADRERVCVCVSVSVSVSVRGKAKGEEKALVWGAAEQAVCVCERWGIQLRCCFRGLLAFLQTNLSSTPTGCCTRTRTMSL